MISFSSVTKASFLFYSFKERGARYTLMMLSDVSKNLFFVFDPFLSHFVLVHT